ncbi:MAG: Sua5/YciO/YrdC/YwlC family protein, partial [Bacteroidales bacterium]|nr:Sua5/YciO/YrdC/YwlC family protein [Bacteroidales bacterium]
MQHDIFYTNKILGEGGVILYPTDTVWGIGCDATNIEVINRVNAIKNRQQGQP